MSACLHEGRRMKVVVLGGGVIGVTSAYYLNQAGCDVTLIERAPSAAQETSHANGGQISWSSASPWAAPGLVPKALGWLLRRHSPLVLRPRLDPALWRWLVRMLGECRARRYLDNKRRMHVLSRYSHDCYTTLLSETGILCDRRRHGILIVAGTSAALRQIATEAALFDLPHRVLDVAGCIAHEPALARSCAAMTGGVWFPDDESGDCHLFTQALALRARENGVRMLFDAPVEHLERTGGECADVVTRAGRHPADAVVVACGSLSTRLLAPLGIPLPVYPVKGYSLTAPVLNEADAPQGSVTDEHHKVVVTRLGNRLRAAGTAELAGYDLTLPRARCATLRHVVAGIFPQACDYAGAQYWCGLRPMTPDNLPVIGATPLARLWINTGHGTQGWTQACGSARLLADLITGQRPQIDAADYRLVRYG